MLAPDIEALPNAAMTPNDSVLPLGVSTRVRVPVLLLLKEYWPVSWDELTVPAKAGTPLTVAGALIVLLNAQMTSPAVMSQAPSLWITPKQPSPTGVGSGQLVPQVAVSVAKPSILIVHRPAASCVPDSPVGQVANAGALASNHSPAAARVKREKFLFIRPPETLVSLKPLDPHFPKVPRNALAPDNQRCQRCVSSNLLPHAAGGNLLETARHRNSPPLNEPPSRVPPRSTSPRRSPKTNQLDARHWGRWLCAARSTSDSQFGTYYRRHTLIKFQRRQLSTLHRKARECVNKQFVGSYFGTF